MSNFIIAEKPIHVHLNETKFIFILWSHFWVNVFVLVFGFPANKSFWNSQQSNDFFKKMFLRHSIFLFYKGVRRFKFKRETNVSQTISKSPIKKHFCRCVRSSITVHLIFRTDKCEIVWNFSSNCRSFIRTCTIMSVVKV